MVQKQYQICNSFHRILIFLQLYDCCGKLITNMKNLWYNGYVKTLRWYVRSKHGTINIWWFQPILNSHLSCIAFDLRWDSIGIRLDLMITMPNVWEIILVAILLLQKRWFVTMIVSSVQFRLDYINYSSNVAKLIAFVICAISTCKI